MRRFPVLYRNAREPMVVVSHAARKIIRRVGTGIEPEKLAARCWKAKKPYPNHWVFPRKKGTVYLRYGDCVFVFGRSMDGTRVNCVTVFGPFRPDGTWWENEVFKRT